jgi:opacity protein-like surface antigen
VLQKKAYPLSAFFMSFFSRFFSWCTAGAIAVFLCHGAQAQVWAQESGHLYFRAAAGAIGGQDADFSDENCASKSPPALFGCGPGRDGRSLGTDGDFGTYLMLELAGGRYLNQWLRTDLSVHFRPNMKYSGSANFLNVSGPQPVSTTAQSLGVMANIFVELAPLFDLSHTRWHPYLGAGLGISRNKLDNVKYRFPEAQNHRLSITPSGTRWDAACHLTAGLGFIVTEKWVLDMSIRYEDLGSVETDRGKMYMDHIDGAIDIAKTEADLKGFGALVGLRYHF